MIVTLSVLCREHRELSGDAIAVEQVSERFLYLFDDFRESYRFCSEFRWFWKS